MKLSTLILPQLLWFLADGVVADGSVNGINLRHVMEELEHIMVDNQGYNSDGLVNAITPCSNFIGGTDNQGEQSTAEWVRLVFHDIATADIAAGTGGLDASIGFESLRDENVGLHFINDSVKFFNPDVNAYASMADMIALAMVMSVATCDGTTTGIELRGGRIDATEAGPSGVPEPTQDINSTLAQFAAAGFNQSEAIALTACGHTLGSVHYANFPDIIDEDVVTTTNEDGAVGFDTTTDVFDNVVITEYLDGTGNAGGPLVTTFNVSQRSDLRLFSSDNNATMQALADADTFQSTCNTLFTKMLNTVPSTVTLSDIITPMTWKVIDPIMDISSAGKVSISGQFRYLYTDSALSSVSYTYESTSNSSTLTASTVAGSGTGLYGSTKYYDFNTTTDSPGTTALYIEDTYSYPITDDIFIVAPSSTYTSNKGSLKLVAAALTDYAADSMVATIYTPSSQSGSASQIVKTSTLTMTASKTVGNYTLYSGSGTYKAGGGGSIVVKVTQGDYESDSIKADVLE